MKIAEKYYQKQTKNKLQIKNNVADLKDLWIKYKKEYIILLSFLFVGILLSIYLIVKFINYINV